MAADDYLGLGSRLDSGPSELLVRTGFGTEIRQAGRLHYWLGVADLAHVLALRDAGVLPEAPGRQLLAALLDLLDRPADESGYSPEHGDAYNSREHLLRAKLGDDAGWLSLGRTRREAGRVSYYLAARAALLAAHETVEGLAGIARRRALAHAESWWADMTYWQPAQVSTFGHYLLSFAWEADRNLDRVRGAWERCELVPAAAGGVAGTTVPLSRAGLLRHLGLTGQATTSRDAMWSVDGLLDVAFAAQQAALTVRRLAEDFLLFAAAPFGYVRLHDSHCRASVHLPQKRNPYALTVIRGGYAVVAGRVTGVAAAAATGSAQTDNWIYNYGETLDALDLARDLSALTAEVIALASFDTDRMAGAALDGFTEAADLAERLVAERGIDYRTAHSLVGRAAAAAERRGERQLSPADLRTLEPGTEDPTASSRDDPLLAVDPRSLVTGRPHAGGAAPAQVRASARRLAARLARQRAWRAGVRAQTEEALAALESEARAAAAVGPPPVPARGVTRYHAHPSSIAPTAPDPPEDPLMPVLRTPDDRFEGLPEFSFQPHYLEVHDPGLGNLRMHYVDEGDPRAATVLILHGEPAWSFMFRRTIPVLADAGLRVVVPDLVGFGRSDKPASQSDYTYDSHVRWLAEFVTALGLRGAVLLGHDWGGLLGLRLVTEIPGLASGYVAVNHGYPTGDMPPNDALRQWQEYAAAASDFDVAAIVDRACVTDLPADVLRGYDAPYPDDTYKAGARVFPALIPSRPDDPSSEAVRASRTILVASTMPFLTVYGEQDPIGGAADAMFHGLVPGATGQPHVRLANAGHNMPEDAGETLGTVVAAFAKSAVA